MINWDKINWKITEKLVNKLQIKIAKAFHENDIEKVNDLQRVLARTHEARLLAIKRVLSASGSKTPGVDNLLFDKHDDQSINELYDFLKDLAHYKAKPVKRVGIPKSNGKIRYLGIPTIKDRCMQALYVLTLFPISEVAADVNSFGFRPGRSTKDAIEHLYKSQYESGSRKPTINWILDADIKGFFDNISHDWIRKNIILEKRILNEFLEAGYIDQGFEEVHDTKLGVPQGGIISPMIANLTLDGLESNIYQGLHKRGVYSKTINNTSYVRYADDFIITCPYKWVADTCLEVTKDFLMSRGLELNLEKSKTLNLALEPVKYLGFSIVRAKDGRSFVIPDPDKVDGIIKKTKEIVSKANTMNNIIVKLNPILRGWANYYTGCSAHETFHKVDNIIHNIILQWGMKRLMTRSDVPVYNKYFADDFNKGFKILRPYYLDEKKNRVPLYMCRFNKINYHRVKRPVIFDVKYVKSN